MCFLLLCGGNDDISVVSSVLQPREDVNISITDSENLSFPCVSVAYALELDMAGKSALIAN